MCGYLFVNLSLQNIDRMSGMLAMLTEADRSATLTLIGTSLIKFASGIIGIWGAINIYFFSYLHNHGTAITPLTNSTILLCAIVPSAFAMLFSTKLSRLFGYKAVIRMCGVIFAVVPYVINIQFNLWVLGLCYLVIPVSCLSISGVPVLNCLWSQFPGHLNKVSGIAVLFFSLGSIVFNIIFVNLTNPHNLTTILEGESGQMYFTNEVADNIFKASNINFLVSGICYLIGSVLVSKKEGLKDNNSYRVDELPQESPPNNAEVGEQGIENDNSPDAVPKNQKKIMENGSDEGIMQKVQSAQNKLTKVKHALKDRRFIILFTISYFEPLYLIYLSMYMKLIFMPTIHDDHYLSYCGVSLTAAAIIAAPIWGCVGDHKGFKFSLILVILFDIVVKVLGLFCTQKWNIIILYFMLSFNDKGILTLIGPGLIEIFGLEMATELIPYKGFSLFLAYITVPVFQLLIPNYNNYKTLLIIFIVFSCLAVGLGIYFYRNVECGRKEKGQRQQQLQEKQYLP